MTDVAAAEPIAVSDADLLARFTNARNVPTGSRTLGFRVVEVCQAEQRIVVEFDARAELLCNPMGQIQGGFTCAMLDECMSVAGMVTSGMTHVVPTLEMKTSFLRPAMPGLLRGTGRVLKWGKSIAFLEGELIDSEGRLLAKATATGLPTPFKSFRK